MTGPTDLVGGVWKLQSMERAGAARFVPQDPDRFAVEFRADGRVGVVADCNQCGGRYSVSGATLAVSELACTLALCADPGGAEFVSLLDGSSSFDRDGDELEIESPEGKLVLRR